MSEYKSFERCFVCRTKSLVQEYDGSKEVTLLLNALLGLLCLPVEKKNFSASACEEMIQKFDISISRYGNSFNSYELLRNLRNGIAHLNIETTSEVGQISMVRISNEYHHNGCNHEPPCPEHCVPKDFTYKVDTNKAGIKINCEFEATPSQLKKLALFIADSYLDKHAKKGTHCVDCEHKS